MSGRIDCGCDVASSQMLQISYLGSNELRRACKVHSDWKELVDSNHAFENI